MHVVERGLNEDLLCGRERRLDPLHARNENARVFHVRLRARGNKRRQQYSQDRQLMRIVNHSIESCACHLVGFHVKTDFAGCRAVEQIVANAKQVLACPVNEIIAVTDKPKPPQPDQETRVESNYQEVSVHTSSGRVPPSGISKLEERFLSNACCSRSM